ncbi:hypothetical protein IW262DRAFT_1291216 [Armillaria fumosa]|nr:hypothetical protein IW262DRAFT_1291216 [Armillaria fumosa]
MHLPSIRFAEQYDTGLRRETVKRQEYLTRLSWTNDRRVFYECIREILGLRIERDDGLSNLDKMNDRFQTRSLLGHSEVAPSAVQYTLFSSLRVTVTRGTAGFDSLYVERFKDRDGLPDRQALLYQNRAREFRDRSFAEPNITKYIRRISLYALISVPNTHGARRSPTHKRDLAVVASKSKSNPYNIDHFEFTHPTLWFVDGQSSRHFTNPSNSSSLKFNAKCLGPKVVES